MINYKNKLLKKNILKNDWFKEKEEGNERNNRRIL